LVWIGLGWVLWVSLPGGALEIVKLKGKLGLGWAKESDQTHQKLKDVEIEDP
jgi:hypothetical protein